VLLLRGALPADPKFADGHYNLALLSQEALGQARETAKR
jgi:hypothetical protein